MNEIEKANEYLAPIYKWFPIVLSEGNGCYVKDINGKSYLDFTAGIGVNSLGYCHPKWVQALTQQAMTLNHTSNLYYHPQEIHLAEKLCKAAGMKKTVFVNSGAEANEVAIKTARKYGNTQSCQKHEIISLSNSFHGRTIMTLSATGQDSFHHSFGPFDTNFKFVPINDSAALSQAINPNTCAIMIECIQGEGGVVALEDSYIQTISTICAQQDILLIVDEVQTGIGRTGKMFSYQHFGLHPDIVTIAKGLGGGLPIGAVLMGTRVESTLVSGDHGSTFAGNPIVCAGANVVMDIIDDSFLNDVEKKGCELRAALLLLPHVLDVEGKGLMFGIKFDKTIGVETLINTCMDKGVLFLKAKDRLRLLPPLIISESELDSGIQILKEVLVQMT